MNCAYLAFTAKGLALAQQLAQTCPGSVSRCGLGGVTLAGWTAQQFAAADYLCAQIDMQNQEFDLYQNNAALYNKAYSDYASYYNRKIMPVSGARFNAWGVR